VRVGERKGGREERGVPKFDHTCPLGGGAKRAGLLRVLPLRRSTALAFPTRKKVKEGEVGRGRVRGLPPFNASAATVEAAV